ncbi:squalene epoxidase 3-like [Corylus avellana]|uniref:squalene epoxidase 3-like n=1 Tax=Corylus avellana TaxID=13451 RepID=UPI00286B9D08|nr:squalene epoxidase 3-like [Corylus avellana]
MSHHHTLSSYSLSLWSNIINPHYQPTPITPRRSKTRASIPPEVEGKGELFIPAHCCCCSSSSSWFHCFVRKKEMFVIGQHVLWTFFASLFGFVLLYTLRRNNNSNANKRKTKKMTFPQECAKESFPDGKCRPVNGSGTDVIIVGAGVAGSALAYTLAKDGRRVHVIERDLTEPDRIVGELLQPGGYLKLIELGLEDCLEEIDAQRVLGYALFKDEKNARLSYPLEKFDSDVAGRSFHNGRFIQRMREKAATLSNVQLEQGTVTSLLEENGVVRGVQYKSKDGQLHKAYAPLTVVCDGCFSNLRRTLCNPKVDVPSCFVGLVLENCQLPFANHGHVILADPSPILFYPISSTEVRCLVDVPGQKLPSVANGEMASYLKTVVAPQIPSELHDAFIAAVDKGNIRTMPNRSMPADPHPTPGALLMGDAFNMRHPLTGGGMTVALSDIVVLRDLLKPLRNLNDAGSLSKYLESFYTLRKPMASTINTLAGALYKVFSASPDPARKEMRQACFDYLSLGGIFSTGPVAILSGLNPRPLSLFLHFFAVAIYGVARLLLPYPSPRRMWIGARLISGASCIIFPIIKAEGVRQMFLPATVPAYYSARAPPHQV